MCIDMCIYIYIYIYIYVLGSLVSAPMDGKDLGSGKYGTSATFEVYACVRMYNMCVCIICVYVYVYIYIYAHTYTYTYT